VMTFEERFYASVQFTMNSSLIDAGLVDEKGLKGAYGEKMELAWALFRPRLEHDIEELKKQMQKPYYTANYCRNNGYKSCRNVVFAALALLGLFLLLRLFV